MSGTPATAAILAALHATRTSARDRQTAMERSIREEARRLRQAEGGEAQEGDEATEDGGRRVAPAAAAGGAAAGRAVVDLDGLAFAQGGHFMSNKGCTLPPGSYRWGKPVCWLLAGCPAGSLNVCRMLVNVEQVIL